MANISYGVNIIPKTNNTYTIGNSNYKWSNIYTVQINGTNVSSLATTAAATTSTAGLMSAADKTKLDGIGIATSQNLGLVKTHGMGISVNSTNGEIYIDKSDLANIKAGTNDYAPIVASNQHEATFYGLAKAAGDTTQYLSSNAVGTYTSDAKTAIKSMLGVTEVPAVTSSDNGKVLRVVNGAWSAVSLPSASGVSF